MVGVRLNSAAPHPNPLPRGERGRSELFDGDVAGLQFWRTQQFGRLGAWRPLPSASAVGARHSAEVRSPSPRPSPRRGEGAVRVVWSEWLVCRSGGRNSSAGSVFGVFCPAPARSALGIRLNIVAPHPSPLPGGARGGPSCLTGMWLGCRSDGRRTSPCSVRMTAQIWLPLPFGERAGVRGRWSAHRMTLRHRTAPKRT